MLPHAGITATSSRLPIEIRRFPWIKPLAVDYALAYARLADFFMGNPAEPAAWREAIARSQQHVRQRDAIAGVVQAQQRRREAPPQAVDAAARLRDPQTVAIVTGQQAGLFGGPLFTLLKAVTAIQLAERVSREHRVPVVPVFWIDAEDHDWNEVKACGILDTDLNLADVTLGEPAGAGHGSVAQVRMDHSAVAALDALAAALPPTEFTEPLMHALRRAYRPGNGMAEAFGEWIESVLGPRGLVVFDASDPAAKPLAAGIFARELEHPGVTSRLAAGAGAALAALGYHAQVVPHDDHLALFHLDGTRAGISADEAPALRERARARPEEFSPGVLLRPLVQDTLFPTVCYVAGPNELAYLGQLRGVYETFGVPMPLMHQRSTATLLDSNAMRFLARHELPLESLRHQDEGVLNQLLEAQIPAAVHESLEEAARATSDRMAALARTVAQIDPTLEASARSTLGRMQDDLRKLHGKIIQAVKRKDDTLRRQFRHAQAQAFPGGHPQERSVGFVYFLNRHGHGLVDRLLEDLPPDQGTHWVITV